MNAAERVRQRVILLMDDLNLSQRELAKRVARTQPWVAKVVRGPKRGGQDVRLEDLDELAIALGVTAVELVRDPGLEFVSDLTPSEMRVLDQLRRVPQNAFDAVRTLLTMIRGDPHRLNETRHPGTRGVDHERAAIAAAERARRAIEADLQVDAEIEARKKAGPNPSRLKSDTRMARKGTR